MATVSPARGWGWSPPMLRRPSRRGHWSGPAYHVAAAKVRARASIAASPPGQVRSKPREFFRAPPRTSRAGATTAYPPRPPSSASNGLRRDGSQRHAATKPGSRSGKFAPFSKSRARRLGQQIPIFAHRRVDPAARPLPARTISSAPHPCRCRRWEFPSVAIRAPFSRIARTGVGVMRGDCERSGRSWPNSLRAQPQVEPRSGRRLSAFQTGKSSKPPPPSGKKPPARVDLGVPNTRPYQRRSMHGRSWVLGQGVKASR